MRIGRGVDRPVEWEGKMVALDRFRATVRLETKKPSPPEGSNVWLQFGPRQKESPTFFGGMVWGVDPDGSITVLLSLTTREFHNLKSLVKALLSGETAPVPPRFIAPEPRPQPQAEPPVTPVPPRPIAPEPRPELKVEPPVTSVPPRPEPPDVSMVQQADALAAQGDYEGAWRLYYEVLQATPEDVSLWYGLGVTLSYLNKRKEAEEAFQYVARHGRPDSEEVRAAWQWLVQARALAESAALAGVAEPVGDVREDKTAAKGKAARRAPEPSRAAVQPPHSKPSEPRSVQQAEARVTRVPPRRESSKVNLAQEAEALAARGDYEGAWKLYYRAVQAAPEDISLWYGLGVTASNLSQRREPEATPQRAVPHGQPDPKEVSLTRRALISAGALAELSALLRVPEPVGDVREDKTAPKRKAARRASEPSRAPVQPPRSKPSEPGPVRTGEARVTQRQHEGASDRSAPRRRIDSEGFDDRTNEGSMTKDERERALVALVKEGYKMPLSRTELMAKVMEMRNKGDKEKSKASKKARGRTRF